MKYTKKPVTIEAHQFDGTRACAERLIAWMGAGRYNEAERMDQTLYQPSLDILTLEDGHDGRAKHVASVGDWIIKGVKDEFYACKPDIFEATYDSAIPPSPSTASEADERATIEAAAKAIYRYFPGAEAHPWVEGGNSFKQDEARRYARAALAAKTAEPDTNETEKLADYCRTLNGVLAKFYKALEPFHFDTHEEAAAKIRSLAQADVAARCRKSPQPSTGKVDVEAERKLFEAWMVSEAKCIVGSRDPYPAGLERDWWKVWLAARRAQAEGTRDAERYRIELLRLRDWFESQRKVISKGCGSSWDMGQCWEQIETIDAAIAATQSKDHK